MTREPTITATKIGQTVKVVGLWHEWSWTDDGLIVVWVRELPLIEEGDEVGLMYSGPEWGDTANQFEAPIEKIEPAHGGFHLAIDAGEEFIDAFGSLPEDGSE